MKLINRLPYIIIFLLYICHTVNTFHSIDIQNSQNPFHITIIGSGYVGLVTGACLAEIGNYVTCVDVDKIKIQQLKKQIIPIYEEGLDQIIEKNVANGRLFFTSKLNKALENSDIVFIAVGTPLNKKKEIDLHAFKKVIKQISEHIKNYKVIVIKSTVPVGINEWTQHVLVNKYHISPEQFDLVSNPEFLREGVAINDFFYPDRIILGSTSEKALEIMKTLYIPITNNTIPMVITSPKTAELIKYASNAFLATKISFINEIANLCEKTGANCSIISHALGLDKRIGSHYLKPGPGFGGSCLPKDIITLLSTAKKYNLSLPTICGALKSNIQQQRLAVKKIMKIHNNQLEGKTIAILGLAFKPNTDDIRYSPAIPIIEKLLNYNIYLKVYDPMANYNMSQLFPNITYCTNWQDTVTNADFLIVLTEWDEFKNINIEELASLMKNRAIIDMRNILNHETLKKYKFAHFTIGYKVKNLLKVKDNEVSV